MLASLAAALGAVIGGLTVWAFALWFPSETKAALLLVPGISEASFSTVHHLYQSGLYQGMVQGAFSGVPYKIFAAEAGFTGISPVQFAALTPFARLPRFALLSVTTWALFCTIGDRWTRKTKLIVSLVLWVVFYLGYFSVVGW